jgi:transposase IS66-like protein
VNVILCHLHRHRADIEPSYKGPFIADQRHGGEGGQVRPSDRHPQSSPRELFAGSDEGAQNWAAIASLIETCKLNSVNLHAWLADTLRKLVYRWPASLIDELMPWAFTPAPTSMCD